MLLSRYLRRRTIVKLLLIGLVAYTFYISLAAFGTIGDLNDGSQNNENGNGNNNNNDVDSGHHQQQQVDGQDGVGVEPPVHDLNRARRIIDENDNMRNYGKIKKYG